MFFSKICWLILFLYAIINLFLEEQMEKYPSPVEGTGLENQEVGNGAGVRIPLSPPIKFILIAGWSSSVARWAHNPEVVGSNPTPATNGPLV